MAPRPMQFWAIIPLLNMSILMPSMPVALSGQGLSRVPEQSMSASRGSLVEDGFDKKHHQLTTFAAKC
ncbi:hypothetical protein BT63DRAFT_161160 [Microthyrium microscopicum]|uniref:Uncharacterized protein n=1 Tax=Microthyrium microscopicum TaxID=703497 RepID=A0A6A6UMV1_9PEZI|nr:hypothetical protein BT63DRAFT_161160 [Microthyrium microscopicum]